MEKEKATNEDEDFDPEDELDPTERASIFVSPRLFLNFLDKADTQPRFITDKNGKILPQTETPTRLGNPLHRNRR